MNTLTFAAIKDGKRVRLVQTVNPRGQPRCIACTKTIPNNVPSRWFCQQSCAVTFAHVCAEGMYVPAAPDKAQKTRPWLAEVVTEEEQQ